jgi:hypothetical protein
MIPLHREGDVIGQRTGEGVCHYKVAEVARAAAGELYEHMMSNDAYFRAWKQQNPGATSKELEKRFIDRNWGKCIEFARRSLALMLRKDDVPEKVKDEIMDVLVKDQMVRGIGTRF